MKINVTYFGQPKIHIDGEQIIFPFVKAEALLYYILIGRKVSRERLIDMLWPTASESSGRHNLRNTIYTLRKVIDQDMFVKKQRTFLELSPTFTFESDYHDWCGQKQIKDYAGDFLDGFTIKKASGYMNWMLELRRNTRVEFLNTLKKEITHKIKEYNYEALINLGNVYLKYDEFDEWVWRVLIKAYRDHNQIKSAIETYRKLETVLEKELSIQPDNETQELYQTIMTERKQSKHHKRKTTKPDLFARAYEQKTIAYSIDKFINGQPPMSYLISGETGIGKTVLLRHAVSKVQESKAFCIDCRCYHPDKDSLMKVWNVFLEKLLYYANEEGIAFPEPLISQLKQYFPGLVVNLQLATPTKQTRLKTEDYASLISCILEVLYCLGKEKRIVMFVDDIQWTDHLSLTILREVLELNKLKNVMLVATKRHGIDDIRKTFIHELCRFGILKVLHLERLSYKETSQFVKASLKGTTFPEALLEKIFDETEGNFLFVSEYINLLKQNSDSFQMSTKIKDVLYSRIQDISAKAQKTMNVIAIFADFAELEIIKKISAMGEESLIDSLDELIEKAIIQETTNNMKELHYSFKHQKIRDFVYERLSSVKQRLLHSRVSEALAHDIQASGYDRYAYFRLIYHLERSGNLKEVLKYRLAILKEYLDLSHEMFPLVNDGRNCLVSILSREEAQQEFAYVNKAIEQMQEQYPGDVGILKYKLTLLHLEGRYHIQTGHNDYGVKCIDQLIKLSLGYNQKEAQLKGLIQRIFYGINKYDTELMIESLKSASEIANAKKLKEEQALILRLYGCYYTMIEAYEIAEDYLTRSIAAFKAMVPEEQYSVSIGAAYNILGDCHLHQKRWTLAVDYYEKAISLCRNKGILSGSAVCLVKLGIIAYELEDYEKASRYFDQALELYEKLEIIWLKHILVGYRGLLDLRLGRSDQVVEYLNDPTIITQLHSRWRQTPFVKRLLTQICKTHKEQLRNHVLFTNLPTHLCDTCYKNGDCKHKP